MSLIVCYYMLSAAFDIFLGPLSIICLFEFFFFFCLFLILSLLCCVACGILVLQHQGQAGNSETGDLIHDVRPPESFQPHGILIGKNSPKGLCLNNMTWPDTKASKFQFWILHTKQLAKQK